jgi:hypothetical protein
MRVQAGIRRVRSALNLPKIMPPNSSSAHKNSQNDSQAFTNQIAPHLFLIMP